MQIFDNNNENRKLLVPIAHQALTSTCQLFHDTKTKKLKPSANGCCVLFQHNEQYYALSCAHVITDDQFGKTFALMNDGAAINLAGETFHSRIPLSNKRSEDSLDIAVAKLNPDVVAHMKNSGYNFLTAGNVKTGIDLTKGQQLMLAGYPASKTALDKNEKRLKFQPLVTRTIPVIQKNESPLFPKAFHHFISFPYKSFREASTGERRVAPNLEGMSGSGIWMLATSDHVTVFPLLIGILSEFDKNKSTIISTKIDLFMSMISQKFDSSVPNNGVELEILK